MDNRDDIKTRTERVIRAAHFLIVWTHQEAINVNVIPTDSWNVKDLHPSIWNGLNSAERDLYYALMALDGELLGKGEKDG